MLALLLLAAAVDCDNPAAAAQPPLYRVEHRLEANDCLDRSVWHSSPDSLRLNAASNDLYHCLPARSVKGGRRYRLSFHYLIAAGSDGIFVVRVNDYDVSRLEWSLAMGPVSQSVDLDFTTRPGVTSACVIFEAESAFNVYECWVDDVVLKPVGEPDTVGP